MSFKQHSYVKTATEDTAKAAVTYKGKRTLMLNPDVSEIAELNAGIYHGKQLIWLLYSNESIRNSYHSVLCCLHTTFSADHSQLTKKA